MSGTGERREPKLEEMDEDVSRRVYRLAEMMLATGILKASVTEPEGDGRYVRLNELLGGATLIAAELGALMELTHEQVLDQVRAANETIALNKAGGLIHNAELLTEVAEEMAELRALRDMSSSKGGS